ncbi:septal ring lytic transglycosylase RlpA family protein [Acuticoccus sp. MNP-M23]|uniref:septal ring lytic transglycosylase RlpA family protein n=1 Tax=Acuticoccus sp. MNP-M23 TaxID=3072793 RepID=UPI0028161D1A|nr:septal ring lytic transglycosylase RlpA family protein [Acuticoccus sp. MNP-M23]WMS42193.1 septal ring lytic transglycosylase RlpA family protein [Acuticoccus sp. MNP-M23]
MTGPYRIAAPLFVLLCAVLAGCNGTVGALEPALSVASSDDDAQKDTAARTMIGKPYKVGGRWYHPKEDKSYDKTGMASWYGPKFHGRSTANGERFDQHALTAAHPTLPLPSYVRVTVVNGGRSAVVRVNDRGPFKPGRILDVSKAAAKKLGFINAGHAKVRVEYLGPAEANGTDNETLIAAARYKANGNKGGASGGKQVASLSSGKKKGSGGFSLFGKRKADDDEESAKLIEVKLAATEPVKQGTPLPGVQTRYLPRQAAAAAAAAEAEQPSAAAYAETQGSSGALDAVIAMNEAEADVPPPPKVVKAQPLPESASEASADRVLGAFDMFATGDDTGISTAVAGGAAQ